MVETANHDFGVVPGAMRIFSLLILAVFVSVSFAVTAGATEREFYRGVQGKWSGQGEIVAGKFKNTRFTCNLEGISPDAITGINIDGSCRVGMFSQPMSATVERAVAGYSGRFLDGAAGAGLDITGGRYTPSRLVVDIRRKELHGVMAARLTDPDRMNVTISVHVDDRLIPVIGMSLTRVSAPIDRTQTSSIDQ
jgi:hypothetical protein